ncbi:Uma2 family endonuclease [Cyanobacteria bacterium FACHB-63]|nr:Uma2 family endonuclease [Cyanobacteria bacterium FACHB-63]
MSQLKTPVPADTWISATWEEFVQASNDPSNGQVKAYYHNGQMRIESMAALGNPHSRDHGVVIGFIFLVAGVLELDIDVHDNCTYRKTGSLEVQPDASFYVGANVDAIPWEAKIIDLDIYPPPDLVIEVADSSLSDDKGDKRLLYEALGVREYWIVDVQKMSVLAFAIANQGSYKITQSQVLAGLEIAVLEEAFRLSREMNHGKVSTWLLKQFQSN